MKITWVQPGKEEKRMITSDIMLVVLGLVFAVLLYKIADYAVSCISTRWKLLYIVPFVVCMVMVALYGMEPAMTGVYAGAVLFLVGFFKEDKKVRQVTSVMAGVCVAISVPICLLYSGYRAPDYLKDFKEGFESMKAHYVLSDYKDIDWDYLYDEYLPQFEEVDKNHDEVENCILWSEFCQEFYDGHVSFVPDDTELVTLAGEKLSGNDYGLALMTLDSGEVAAVNVEAELAAFGIKNGTIITSWDGRNIEDIEADIKANYMSFPDEDNEAFYKTLLVAGVGGDTVDVTYLDDKGNEQKVALNKLGNYYGRLTDTIELLDKGVDGDNLSWTRVDDETACLRIKMMMYDSESYASGDHSEMKEELRADFAELRDSGVTKLIIDLRKNEGGSPDFVMAIASLLAPAGEYSYCYDGVWDEATENYKYDLDTGKYEISNGLIFQGEEAWPDVNITVLVNAECISAGDHLVNILSKFENVTIMGFTETNGSGQGISAIELESGSLTFSAVLMLNEDGSVFVDTDASRENAVKLDVKIPFDENAIKAIFDDGEDYILQQALK